MFNRFPFRFLVPALGLVVAPALHADWLLDDARQHVLAEAPLVKAMAEELQRTRPRFTLSLSREEVPSMFQLRAMSPDRYVGIVNVVRVRKVASVPELAVAGLYFMAWAEVVPAKAGSSGGMLAFLGRVLQELKRANPGRYGKVKAPQLSLTFGPNPR